MYYVPYERVSHFLAIAKKFNIFHYDIDCSEPMCIKFSDYVKSQIHLNFVSDFFDRSILPYKRVFDSFEGEICDNTEYLKVLRYFYDDLGRFYVNCSYDIPLTFDIDVAMDIESVSVDFSKVREKLLKLTQTKPSSFESALTTAVEYAEFMPLFDKISEFDDMSGRINNYAMAVILANEKYRDRIIRVERVM